MKTLAPITASLFVLLVAGTFLYHCAIHPEWTQMQMLRNLWWAHVIEAVLFLTSMYTLKQAERQERE